MIEIKNCFKKYDFPVLENISLRIEDNEFLILKGPSGSGKSTMLNLISGIIPANRGDIYINNLNITKMRDGERSLFRNKNIAYIRQSLGLVPWLNIEDNLELPYYLAGGNPETMRSSIEEVIRTFDLTKILNKYPDKISGGQYQRAAIASSIIKSPDIILADEPTNNLDKKNIEILKKIFELYKTKKTVILVSHHDIFDYCGDRIAYLDNGKITY